MMHEPERRCKLFATSNSPLSPSPAGLACLAVVCAALAVAGRSAITEAAAAGGAPLAALGGEANTTELSTGGRRLLQTGG